MQVDDFWVANGFSANPGADAEAIKTFEERHSLLVPESFREYLTTVNGMEYGLTDDELISFHSIERIDENWNWYPRTAGGFRELTFADLAIDCHWYVLRFDNTARDLGVWATYDPPNFKQLASTFEGFLVANLSNPAEIACCW